MQKKENAHLLLQKNEQKPTFLTQTRKFLNIYYYKQFAFRISHFMKQHILESEAAAR